MIRHIDICFIVFIVLVSFTVIQLLYQILRFAQNDRKGRSEEQRGAQNDREGLRMTERGSE